MAFVAAPSCGAGTVWQAGACVPGHAPQQVQTETEARPAPPATEPPADDGPAGASVGAPVPAFALDSVYGGGRVTSAALAGRVVVVHFWATFCNPCHKSIAGLQAIHAKYAQRGVAIVAVSEDEKDDFGRIPTFVAAHGAKFVVAWDGTHEVAGKWQPPTMPATYVIDRAGILRFEHDGYHDGEEATIEREVASLL
jgi:peroxiredoxin